MIRWKIKPRPFYDSSLKNTENLEENPTATP